MAERLENPFLATEIFPQEGIFDENAQSFLETDKNLCFLCLKPADDKKGLIMRLYGEEYRVARFEDTNLKTHTCYYYRVCAVDKNENQGEFSEEFSGFTKEI